MTEPAKQKIWSLVALHFDPEIEGPELYALIFEAAPDVPLMVDGRILFFKEASRARALIERHGSHLPADRIDVDVPSMRCDLAQALHFLSAGGFDETASVVNCVNVLLDFVRGIGAELGEERKRVLYSIADYTTTSKDLTRYLEEEGDYPSRQLVDAVLCASAPW
jgi:hypothetical protein